MHTKLSIVFLLLCFIFLGCTEMPEKLKSAQEVMERYPDSALRILQNIPPENLSKDADRAYYGILLFQALDKIDQTLPSDSIISFSLNYFQSKNKRHELAISYYFKAKLFKKVQRFDDATMAYLKALDIVKSGEDDYFIAKIYSDMGDICAFQKDFKESLQKYRLSLQYFHELDDTIESCYKLIDIGRVHRFLNDPDSALYYYSLAQNQINDSLIWGIVNQEIGVDYFLTGEYDYAKKYLKKSLDYPYRGTGYSIRLYVLSDVYYKKSNLDSAIYYAEKALMYPNTFFIQRDCYRVLANSEYDKGNFEKSGIFMSRYQECTDSVRQIEIQTKSKILEDVHVTQVEFDKSKYSLFILIVLLVLVLFISLAIYNHLRSRNKQKVIELERVEDKLIKNQVLLKDNLVSKINEIKVQRSTEFKVSNLKQRELIIKEVYYVCLHLGNWDAFEKLMNQTFNDFFKRLIERCPDINKKELIWSALSLLDVPSADMAIILECQQASIYKLKQRLTQKLNLTSTKDLDQLLMILSSEK